MNKKTAFVLVCALFCSTAQGFSISNYLPGGKTAAFAGLSALGLGVWLSSIADKIDTLNLSYQTIMNESKSASRQGKKALANSRYREAIQLNAHIKDLKATRSNIFRALAFAGVLSIIGGMNYMFGGSPHVAGDVRDTSEPRRVQKYTKLDVDDVIRGAKRDSVAAEKGVIDISTFGRIWDRGGGGDCLFRSLVDEDDDHDTQHSLLRAEIVEEASKFAELSPNDTGESVIRKDPERGGGWVSDEKIKKMRKDSIEEFLEDRTPGLSEVRTIATLFGFDAVPESLKKINGYSKEFDSWKNRKKNASKAREILDNEMRFVAYKSLRRKKAKKRLDEAVLRQDFEKLPEEQKKKISIKGIDQREALESLKNKNTELHAEYRRLNDEVARLGGETKPKQEDRAQLAGIMRGKVKEAYKEHMGQKGVYGSDREIQAYANLKNKNVILFVRDGSVNLGGQSWWPARGVRFFCPRVKHPVLGVLVKKPQPTGGFKTIYITLGGQHYQRIIKRSSPSSATASA